MSMSVYVCMKKYTHFQWCHQQSGEMVAIKDNTKQQEVKQFIKSIVAEHTLTLPRNDLLSRLYWGTQWTMEIS